MPSNALIDATPPGPPLPSHLQNGRPNRAPEDRWDNEGGASPPHTAAASSAPPAAGRKQPHDTVAGCRVLARDDLARAADADTVHGRLKLEHSAATWTDRGDMLQGLATRRDRREAAATPI